MKWFLASAATLALSCGLTGTAAQGSSRSGSYSHHGSGSSGRQLYLQNHTSSYSAVYHREYHGPYYQGVHNRFWSSRYWSDRHGCYLYWCPRTLGWFYWCEPFACYYPIEYCPTGRYAY